jgi:hypothetical protein
LKNQTTRRGFVLTLSIVKRGRERGRHGQTKWCDLTNQNLIIQLAVDDCLCLLARTPKQKQKQLIHCFKDKNVEQ